MISHSSGHRNLPSCGQQAIAVFAHVRFWPRDERMVLSFDQVAIPPASGKAFKRSRAAGVPSPVRLPPRIGPIEDR